MYISLYILDIKVGGADVCDLLEAVEGLMAIVEEIYDFGIGLFVEKFHFEFIDLSAFVEVEEGDGELLLLLEDIG